MEPWNHILTSGELVTREQMLTDIRQNLISVIQDYAAIAPDNEAQLTQQAEQLFTGDIVPSRDDWNTLNTLLRELAVIKEEGDMYAYFIRDVSDSLGVSDLERIRDFIDYIQSIPPKGAGISVRLNPPGMYAISGVTVQNNNTWDTVTLAWDVTHNYLDNPTGDISIAPSASEDIANYRIDIEAGSYRESLTKTATEALDHQLTLNWRSWFSGSQLDDVWMKASITAIDKRDNETTQSGSAKYPSSVTIPQGVGHYEIQVQRDYTNWVTIKTTTSKSLTWDIPRINGNYAWRVRAYDKSGRYTTWSTTGRHTIRFTPDPPSKPVVSIDTSVRLATVTWTASARADYYEVWHGGEQWAKDHSTGTAWSASGESGNRYYWTRVEADEPRTATFGPMNEGATYRWYVRAVNEGGTNTGNREATMKRRVTKTASYTQTGIKIWRGKYTEESRWGKKTSHDSTWRSADRLYQGGWKEIVRSSNPRYPGWDARGGGRYYAWGLQEWGNHMSFLFLDYNNMRSRLAGKEITSVKITLTRSKDQYHGWPSAKPIYLYNHKKDSSMGAPETHPFYRADGVNVTDSTQQALANISFTLGETEVIQNTKTRQLIENIVDGSMTGLGIARYYGAYFNSPLDVGDKAYMKLNPSIKIDIKYLDIV